MLETSARLLRLLSLLQTHGGLATFDRHGAAGGRRSWSGADLAERLGVTPRTVRRDIDRLRELGYPVHSVPGTAGGYQLGAGADLPPLLLDDDEAVAVAVGLRTAPGGVQGIEESTVRALAKLEQVLPDRLRRRISALNAYTVPMLSPAGQPAIDPSILSELAHACRDRERVRFAYRDHQGGVSRRTTEPYRLVCSRARWYLVAWDVDRADWRTFRADRITPKPPHGPRFAHREPPADDLADYVSRGVSIAAYAQRATVLLRVSAERAAEEVSPSAGVLEAVDEHSCLLHTGAHTFDVLALHIVLMGFDFEVREPPELREHITRIRDRLDRALR
ncbi:helix-turn-helix transcriptional regulator [Streptomyces zagrosensis]|uniref:Putative DNA-binding transcriptional regulator YafY n=1 Tax=Streptomyces zagrosensis TaxID=1042984 RepID=A0A7W9V0N0_9ACTN|nr:YafY family protein [Streptomyces zagrosensis]MBB5937441.1 putative DNA-binding transcriptional regulator YafY [Streptomyces zagrosensis]